MVKNDTEIPSSFCKKISKTTIYINFTTKSEFVVKYSLNSAILKHYLSVFFVNWFFFQFSVDFAWPPTVKLTMELVF